jgi:Calcineurin-like phosphoesterase
MNILRIALVAVGLSSAACATTTPPAGTPGTVAAAWVELGPGGRALVRVITDGGSCPALDVDGRARPTQVRAAADAASFPVTVCEAPLPGQARSATVAGLPLALPTPAPRRIVVIGDTGCRMEAPSDFQACNDATAWPFAQVAERAAAWRPDLVIHLGDFHYRESACPAGNPGCADNPVGDTWASWRADFFTPAARLLRAAPWVVVRGNHEVCRRAGDGWFRFLEPRPRPTRCTDDTAPYVIPLGGAVLAVVDSSPASDSQAEAADVARYTAQFAALAAMRPAYTWLATHRPIWDVVDIGQPALATGNATLQAAIRNRLPSAVTLLLAGHVHLFEALSFAQSRPAALVVGNSGTSLDRAITQPLAGLDVDGDTISAATTLRRFGYVTMEAAGEDWTAEVHGVDGGVLTRCLLTRATVVCLP